MDAFEFIMIPDLNMIPVAVSAVTKYAKYYFKDERDYRKISLALEECLNNVISFSMSRNLQEIKVTVQAEDGKFTVCIYDKGLPGDYATTLEGGEKLGLQLAESVMDEYTIENLGQEGRCQRMTKCYTKEPEFISTPEGENLEPIEGAHITVRPTQKEDVLEICRKLYSEYGMTYSHKDIYYPEKLYEEINKGEIHSIVAVDDDGNIAGHHASWEWSQIPGVWESGMAVVDARYRHSGIFGKMMEVTKDYVLNQNKAKLYISIAATFHTATQTLRLKNGDSPSGFKIGDTSSDALISTFSKHEGRLSAAIACHVTDKTPRTIYVTEQIADIIRPTYEGQGVPRTYMAVEGEPKAEKTEYKVFTNESNKSAMVIISVIGKDFVNVFRETKKMARQSAVEQVEMYIPAEQEGSIAIYEQNVRNEFFFTGLLPCTDYGDMLLMTKLPVQPVSYDDIKTIGPFTEMLEKIRRLDPDQQG